MDLNAVIGDMKSGINEVEPRILDYWEQGDYKMARAEFNRFLAITRYHYFRDKIVEGFDRGVNAIESIMLLGELLDPVYNFSSRNIARGIRHVKVNLAQTALSDGPRDLTIRL